MNTRWWNTEVLSHEVYAWEEHPRNNLLLPLPEILGGEEGVGGYSYGGISLCPASRNLLKNCLYNYLPQTYSLGNDHQKAVAMALTRMAVLLCWNWLGFLYDSAYLFLDFRYVLKNTGILLECWIAFWKYPLCFAAVADSEKAWVVCRRKQALFWNWLM